MKGNLNYSYFVIVSHILSILIIAFLVYFVVNSSEKILTKNFLE